MKYSMDKYRFYRSDNKVYAVSTYAGKSVRGVAKCDPVDTFSIEDGQMLAAARCNEKVAEKRVKRAEKKVKEAYDDFRVALRHLERMTKYCEDAEADLVDAQNYVNDVLLKFAP